VCFWQKNFPEEECAAHRRSLASVAARNVRAFSAPLPFRVTISRRRDACASFIDDQLVGSFYRVGATKRSLHRGKGTKVVRERERGEVSSSISTVTRYTYRRLVDDEDRGDGANARFRQRAFPLERSALSASSPSLSPHATSVHDRAVLLCVDRSIETPAKVRRLYVRFDEPFARTLS